MNPGYTDLADPLRYGCAVSTNDEALPVNVVAERLHVSRRQVYNLIAAGEIQTVRVGRRHRVSRLALDTFIGSRKPRRGSFGIGSRSSAD